MATFYQKQSHCLNCKLQFDSKDNFCPDCGQKNTHPKISFGTLVVDFLGDVFTFDSKIFKSLWYLIAKPGFLSKEFIEGRRIRYIPPLRMFIVLGIIFVALLNQSVDIGTKNLWDTNTEEISDWDETSDHTEEENGQDGLDITEEEEEEIPGISFSFEPSDGVRNAEINARLPWGEDIFNESFKLARETEKTTEEIAVETNASTYFEKALSGQVVKLARKGPQELARWLLNNMSLLFLFMIPLSAFMLKALYIRSDFYTIDHLIFSLHVHSLFYLTAILALFIKTDWIVGSIGLIIFPIYVYLAAKRVYGQGRFKTFLKQVLYAFGYNFTFTFVAVAFLILSFILF